ncbi:NAD(P)-dependent oxidoreductase [Variovorax sp. WS11]|nr:NAD(P)-dependent oxidoreductase [Variovorax sp. WS11]PSL86143.1 NAD(P)-dependent oxidoreductase [Variovorax sp. WS11]
MTASATSIGWIGVGAMGRPMCDNLLRAGHRLTAYDQDRSRLEALVAAGATAASSPGALAAASDVVFSTIFDDAGLRDIVLGSNGIAASAGKGTTYVDMSTVSPAASAVVAEGLAACGIAYLRAPVSGTVTLATTGQLSTFVSGPRTEFERLLPLLGVLTARQSHVGEGEEARVIKLLINLMVFMNTAVLGEALAFGARGGLDRRLMLDAINDSIVGSAHYRGKADKIAQRDHQPVGPISLVIKDMDLALGVARENAAALPIAALVRQSLALMQSRGLSGLDVSALADLDELVLLKPASSN